MTKLAHLAHIALYCDDTNRPITPMTAPILLSDTSLLSIAGPDASTFLQGLITLDLTQYAPGDSPLGAFCNQKGRVIATVRVLFPATPNTYWLMIPLCMQEKLLAHLRRYVLISNVTIDPLATHAVGGKLDGSMHQDATEVTCFLLSKTPFRQLVIAVHNPLGSPTTAMDTLWHQTTLSAGEAWVRAETSEQFTPQMLNYPQLGMVSFSKGCYLGQEIVARTQHLGKQKRGLFMARVDGNPHWQRNTCLLGEDKREITIIDLCHQNTHTTLLFCGDMHFATQSQWELQPDAHLVEIKSLCEPS